jgi:hypothetical protein
MSLNVLEADRRGNVVERPVVGWMVTTDQGVTVLAAFEYRESASELTKECAKLQLTLAPQQALRLADALTDLASNILRTQSGTNRDIR